MFLVVMRDVVDVYPDVLEVMAMLRTSFACKAQSIPEGGNIKEFSTGSL